MAKNIKLSTKKNLFPNSVSSSTVVSPDLFIDIYNIFNRKHEEFYEPTNFYNCFIYDSSQITPRK